MTAGLGEITVDVVPNLDGLADAVRKGIASQLRAVADEIDPPTLAAEPRFYLGRHGRSYGILDRVAPSRVASFGVDGREAAEESIDYIADEALAPDDFEWESSEGWAAA